MKRILLVLMVAVATSSFSYAQQNLLSNWGFEEGTDDGSTWNATAWTVDGANSTVWFKVTDNENDISPNSGSYMLRANLQRSDNLPQAKFEQEVQLVNGKSYGLGFWANLYSPSTTSEKIIVQAIDIDGNWTYLIDQQEVIVNSGSWQYISFDFDYSGDDVAATDEWVKIKFSFAVGGTQNAKIFFDDIKLVEGTATSINDAEVLDVNIYPNPATDVLNVQVEDGVIGVVELFNLSGQKVLSKNINGNSVIPVDGIGDGLYVMKISSSKGNYTSKVVIR
ncbi:MULTISPECIES: T9SS type A sorting domain-containing protein [unclassified Carboxylicivirga]|uniref:T9SS type A sorting domain-containing protein n=1 Tax=Carboxylicivirga TaxID=1628153 RepID=UPI003D3531F7